MRVVHETDAGERVLATEVELAESTLSRARGLMFRRSIPEGYALVIEAPERVLGDRPSRQFVHMLCVRMALDVLWLANGEVRERARLAPWTGVGVARADRVLELPAGAAEGVRVGDEVSVEGLDRR